MKTLISQVVEELMEGYESTSNINDILETRDGIPIYIPT